MKLLKMISLITLSFVFFLESAEARISDAGIINTKQMDKANSWIVMPGSRLVAGDPKQNEFYILERTSPGKVPTMAIKHRIKPKLASQSDIKKIKVVIGKSLHAVNNKKYANKLQATLKPKQNKIAHKKQNKKMALSIGKSDKHKKTNTMLTENN